jgi:surfactin synthase thioesterase subunit
MRVVLNIPEYKPEAGFEFKWEADFTIKIMIKNGVTTLQANKEGLISLANHLLNLAQDSVIPGAHFHLDEHNSLDEGSSELIVEKIV